MHTMPFSRPQSLVSCHMLRRPGGASPMRQTRHVWRHSWSAMFVSAIGQHRACHSTPSVTRPTTGCSIGSPATQDICYILFFSLHVTATTNLGDHTHNFSLLIRSTALLDCNFLTRMLYKDLNYSSFSQLDNWKKNTLISHFVLHLGMRDCMIVCMHVDLSALCLIYY